MTRARGAALPAGIAILGPTGSGKSALAMQLAASLPVELISVDSAQVYRGMDIGTAKPTLEECAAVAHHLIDIREPEEVYSAGEFRTDCLVAVDAVAARGRVPLLVGGTMLYYRALFAGLAQLPTADTAVRARLDARAAREGWPALHAELAARDPAGAARIHPNDAQRIQRALEVLEVSGRPLDAHWLDEERLDFGNWRILLLEPADRAALHAQLARRLESMLSAGFVSEVEQLWARGTLNESSPSMRLVGYRQLLEYVRGRESLSEAVEKALAATRQLAKRQLTWMRSGKLLPNGASVLRVEPSDISAEIKRISRALIEARPPP